MHGDTGSWHADRHTLLQGSLYKCEFPSTEMARQVAELLNQIAPNMTPTRFRVMAESNKVYGPFIVWDCDHDCYVAIKVKTVEDAEAMALIYNRSR